MKVCPKCNTRYADDTLSFCLEDGTPLAAARPTDMPTAILQDTELLTSVRRSGISPDPRFMDSQVTRVGSIDPIQPPRRSNTALTVMLTAVGMILIFGVIGIVGYLIYLNKDRPIISNVEPDRNASTPSKLNSNATPIMTPAANAPAANVTTPASTPVTNSIDEPAIKSEVSKQIYGWKSAMESRDLSSYMSNYAGTVDFYLRRSMSYAEVKAAKAKAFGMYNSMQSELSNMSVSVSPDGKTATASFDKAWTFIGNSTSSGKVRTQLIFKWINDRWLIASERDLKVYYTR